MLKLFVTKKGASLKTNKWIEGQEIEVFEGTGRILIEKGFLTEKKQSKKPKKEEEE